jgi:hypothetical protein
MFERWKERMAQYQKRQEMELYESLIRKNYSLDVGDVVEFDDGKRYRYLRPAADAPGNPGMLEPAFTATEPEFPPKIFFIRNTTEDGFGWGATIAKYSDDGKVEIVIGSINSPWWSSKIVGHITPEEWDEKVAGLNKSLMASE